MRLERPVRGFAPSHQKDGASDKEISRTYVPLGRLKQNGPLQFRTESGHISQRSPNRYLISFEDDIVIRKIDVIDLGRL